MEPKHYRLTRIDGEYAHLENLESGEDMLIAMALLPDDADEGVELLWENFEYTVI